jgi:hypothetical protein
MAEIGVEKCLISGTRRNNERPAGTVSNALQNRCTATVLTRLALRRYLFVSKRSNPSDNGLTTSLNSLSSRPEVLLRRLLLAGEIPVIGRPA